MSTSERPQQGRERSKSTFSFKSHKSHKSHGSRKSDFEHGVNQQQSHHQRTSSKDHDQKPHLHAATKADPNAAMNEVQPSMPAPLLSISPSVADSSLRRRRYALLAFALQKQDALTSFPIMCLLLTMSSRRCARKAHSPIAPRLHPYRCQRQYYRYAYTSPSAPNR